MPLPRPLCMCNFLLASLIRWTQTCSTVAAVSAVTAVSVPAEVKEAAEGMGLTRRQTLLRVELPLAVPAIIAGLRVATVTTISLATIAAFITPLGLGAPIFSAIQTGANTEFVGASLLAIALALLADVLIVLMQRVVSPWTRARRRSV